MTKHVAFAIDGGYAPWAATSMRSCLDRHPPGTVAFHVLHSGGLGPDTEVRLTRMVRDAGGAVEFIDVDPARLAGLRSIDRFGSVVWLRFLLPELLAELPRVLYLDADTFVAGPLDELWDTPLDHSPIGAVANVVEPAMHAHVASLGITDPARFLNSGVLLMNLEVMRAEGASNDLLRFAREKGDALTWPDQDTLNVVFAGRWQPLHPRWNAQNSLWFWEAWADDVFGPTVRQEAIADPGIIHFEGPSLVKPWDVRCQHPWRDEYRRVLRATPWADTPLSGSTGRLPDFLIVGSMKSGTTSVARWLDSHPQVYVPGEKELNFFNGMWDRGIDWYRAQFADAPAGALVGEATPEYMAHRICIERMAQVVPNARLIALLRNPVDRAWSHYNHLVTYNDERRSFTEILDFESALPPDSPELPFYFRCRGRYIDQLRMLTEFFDRDAIHVGLFDDLTAEPRQFFDGLCAFLNIDPSVAPENLGTAYNTRQVQVRHRGDWVPGARRIAALLPGRLRQRLRTATEVADDGGPMPADLRAQLVDYFRPYNDELAAWLGVDLSRWNA